MWRFLNGRKEEKASGMKCVWKRGKWRHGFMVLCTLEKIQWDIFCVANFRNDIKVLVNKVLSLRFLETWHSCVLQWLKEIVKINAKSWRKFVRLWGEKMSRDFIPCSCLWQNIYLDILLTTYLLKIFLSCG